MNGDGRSGEHAVDKQRTGQVEMSSLTQEQYDRWRETHNNLASQAAPLFPLSGKRVWVAGHTGLVGQALVRRLTREDCQVVTVSHAELDLRRQHDAEQWLAAARPQAIILAAATVGGIWANQSRPAEFLYDNLTIAANVVEAARRVGVEKVLLLGSSCIYPREAPQPITEEALLTGPLEPTNQWYALAKIAALKLGQVYREQHGLDCIAAMPTNLYGPGDNFDLESAHVLPALMRKIHEAHQAGDDEVRLWGTGHPLREFLHIDDCADALVFLLKHYSDSEPINVGGGQEISIAQLAQRIAAVVGYQGRFRYDETKPDGTPRKRLDTARLNKLGWQAQIGLDDGLRSTCAWYVTHGQSEAGQGLNREGIARESM